jgi:hypothetical protein
MQALYAKWQESVSAERVGATETDALDDDTIGFDSTEDEELEETYSLSGRSSWGSTCGSRGPTCGSRCGSTVSFGSADELEETDTAGLVATGVGFTALDEELDVAAGRGFTAALDSEPTELE